MNFNDMDPTEKLASLFINITFEQALYRICYVFSLFAVLAALTAGMVYACIWLYELKTSLGIDIFPGFSFFHQEVI